MRKRLVIDGNAVYEIDEDCMLKKRLSSKKEQEQDNGEDHRKDKGGKADITER